MPSPHDQTPNDLLNSFLRCQLTAVNQQFVHILSLRAWGQKEALGWVVSVDNADFPGAMWLMDRLAGEENGLRIASEPFTPGGDLASVLASERTLEARMRRTLAGLQGAGELGERCAAHALGPRRAYWDWLEQTKAETREDGPPQSLPELDDLLSCLIVLVEQTMAHAFLLRHQGDSEAANRAWATSGEAMMRLTALVRAHAALSGMMKSTNPPPLHIGTGAEESEPLDAALARSCAVAAKTAAPLCPDSALASCCREAEAFTSAVADWRPGKAHPAFGRNPKFADFQVTYDKFVAPLNSA